MRTFALLFVFAASAPAQPPCPCPPDLSGEWPTGTWKSDADGHTGPLSATFVKSGEGQYRVTFRGRFWRFFPFRYNVTLDVVGQAGDSACLAGSSRLPLFGTFHYQARASANEFVATYTSGKDHGTFSLRR